MKKTFAWKNRYIIINVLFIVAIIIGFIELTTRPIDVLQDWKMTLTEVEERNKQGLAVYNPGDTLLFTSTSKKLVDAEGIISRSIVCKTEGSVNMIDIRLDTLPAAKPSGVNKPSSNAIFVPDVARFNGLPRECHLSIDVCYKDVILWRDHCEHAQTEEFLVQEQSLGANELREEIKLLRLKIEELEHKLSVAESSSTVGLVAPHTQQTANEQQGSAVSYAPSSANESSAKQPESATVKPQPTPIQKIVSIGMTVVSGIVKTITGGAYGN